MRQRRRQLSEINVVPYIDVMLVLLVIFMVTAPLLSQGVEVDLPNAHASAIESEEDIPLIVTVNKQGLYFLNVASDPAKPMSTQDLQRRVAAELQIAQQRNKPKQVLVRGDASVDYGQVVVVMTLLQQAGAPSVGLMTKPKE